MALHPETFELDDPEQPSRVLDEMSRLIAQGHGWINLRPEIPPDVTAPGRSMMSQFFRRNSPDVALGTWMPDAAHKSGPRQVLGLQHGLGTKVRPLLGDLGLSPGERWRRIQDSPRRGLLVGVPAEEDHLTVLRWLLELTVAVTRVPTTGVWEVTVYEGRV